jgi:hypothetical protein
MVPAAHFAEDVLPCYLACGLPGERNKYARSYLRRTTRRRSRNRIPSAQLLIVECQSREHAAGVVEFIYWNDVRMLSAPGSGPNLCRLGLDRALLRVDIDEQMAASSLFDAHRFAA